MKISLDHIRFFLIAALLAITLSCNKNKLSNIPSLETLDATEITQSSAKAGGIINSDGGVPITSRGVCWNISPNPSISNNFTEDGQGEGSFVSTLTNLLAGTSYYYKAYGKNSAGTGYGEEKVFKTASSGQNSGDQIIADHTIVSDFDKIPQAYINMIKKMWVTVPGESHSMAYRSGATLLEASNPKFQVNVTESGTPEVYTDQHLRLSRATWGNYYNSTGWIYDYGEADWFTNSTAITRTKAGITYCNSNDLKIAAMGFGWCWDMVYGNPSSGVDPVYGCHWYGSSSKGPDGSKSWGLDTADYTETGNRVSMSTYLAVTEEYRKFCETSGYQTKVFFTTGPVESYYNEGEAGYQGYLKHEYIRNFVSQNPSRILFDYADILCYNDDGTLTTATWNGHTFPRITPKNLGGTSAGGHIGQAGAIRLAKAMWWMLARIAGWDGKSK